MMREIAELICIVHGVTLADLKGSRGDRRIWRARQAFMAYAWQPGHGKRSLTSVGRYLNRDHTTVLHGARAHERRMAA